MARKTLRIAAIVVALAVVALALGYAWLRSSGRPRREGSVALAGLAAPVHVRFDRWGVPDIEAASEADAWRALGWLHANDRLFQMEMSRRAASGRLSELLGERALGYDRRMRRLRFRSVAEASAAALSGATRDALEAYAGGVNDWLAARGEDLPPEFRVLRFRPEPWTPADTLSFILMMARDLSPVASPPEIERFELLRAFGADRARDLDGAPGARIFAEIEAAAGARPAEPAPLGSRPESAGLGSNNWTVAPSRSSSGDALLANDPHLGLGLPNVWYQASIRTPTYRAVGMTLPGTPIVTLGRGPDVAWAMTNLYVDDVDVFFERLDQSGTRVARGDGWSPIVVEPQTIRVKDGEPVEIEAKTTDRGIFLDADSAAGLPARSVAWTALERGDQFAAMVALAKAHSVDDVSAAIEPWVFPPQNLLVADRQGHIVWTPIGRAPDRFGWDGRFPAPGWSSEVGWRGLLPPSGNPALLDPPEGLIATANSFLPVPTPEWFGEDFDTSFRMDRIREALAARSDWDVESFAALQGDVVSSWARWLVARLGDGYEGDAARAAEALATWDGAMALRGPSALFALFERALQRDTFEDEARAAGIGRFGTRWRLLRLLEGAISTSWWDDVTTEPVEGRREILARALAEAWREGASRFGPDVAHWDYGALHRITLDHPLGGVPLLGSRWNRGPFPVPGSPTTILAFGGPWREDHQEVTYGPSMRFVTDAARPQETWAVMPGGQSGHPWDAHYDDQIEPYLVNRLHTVPWTAEAIDRATVSRLDLVPGGSR